MDDPKILLKQIWNFCDDQQKRLNDECFEDSRFVQGKKLAYREIQYMINKKCT